VSNKPTLAIIPALNEEATIGAVVGDVRANVPHADVLVIDDGSQDGTAQRARDAGALVSVLPYNLGVGGALRVGYRYAWRWGYERVLQIDGDGQHDPAEIARLFAALDEPASSPDGESLDIVIGARFAGRGDFEVTWMRRMAMRLLAKWLTRLAGTELTDVTSGFRVCGPRAIGLFARTYPVEYIGATVEALVIAVRSGLAVTQVPVRMRPRAGGQPSHGFVRSAIYVVRALAVIAMSRFQRWPPPQVDKDPRIMQPALLDEPVDEEVSP